nr:hypothetical protein BaRGS_027040 [Batillaria attramentaria]
MFLVPDSETLFDSVAVKSEPAAAINLLGDSDDDELVPAKSAPFRKKRQLDDEEEDNPFDFVKKRPKKSPSPKPRSLSPGAEASSRNEKGNESRPVELKDAVSVTENEHRDSEPHRQGDIQHGALASTKDIPVPRGFLTTRAPIKDQVEPTSRFERENIETSAVQVQFESLVRRPTRARNAAEDQSDVPDGMMRWRGRLVPNYKKFRKVLHAGAGQLPRIIGGRDLVEHCGESRKEMDDWLKEMQRAESQTTQREREALELFDYQPAAARKKSRR